MYYSYRTDVKKNWEKFRIMRQVHRIRDKSPNLSWTIQIAEFKFHQSDSSVHCANATCKK
jgi:hypothetical protein